MQRNSLISKPHAPNSVKSAGRLQHWREFTYLERFDEEIPTRRASSSCEMPAAWIAAYSQRPDNSAAASLAALSTSAPTNYKTSAKTNNCSTSQANSQSIKKRF